MDAMIPSLEVSGGGDGLSWESTIVMTMAVIREKQEESVSTLEPLNEVLGVIQVTSVLPSEIKNTRKGCKSCMRIT